MTRRISCLLLLTGLSFPVPVRGAGESTPSTGTGPAVAVVGNREIPQRRLADEVSAALNAKYFHGSVSADKRLELETEALERVVRRELDLLGALDAGMPLPLAEGKAEREKIEKALGKSEYERSIAFLGWNRSDHERVLAEGRLASAARKRFVEDRARVSDEAVRREYQANPKRWNRPETIHVEHILLAVPAGSAETIWNERKGEASALAADLRTGKSRFADAASKISSDMYRIKGGDLGWVHKGRLLPVVEQAAWGAKENELVGPIRSEEGFHVLRVLGRRPSEPLPEAEVLPKLRKELEAKELESVEKAWYESLRAKHPVRILGERLRSKG
jgi:parvulin-like peptidyl-prolyl isomerase